MVNEALIREIRRGLKDAADAEKASAMRRYMKSAMPFRGVQSAAQRQIYHRTFAAHELPDASSWQDTALALWRTARYREERYAAIELTGFGRYRRFQTLEALPMYEEMIVAGAWWDFVDVVAIHRIGPLVAACPRTMSPRMRRWSGDENLWKRRAAIICQIAFKERTKLDLLYACIERNLDDREFFIRKAIGWALRQYAWTDPAEIRRFVRAHAGRLSGLSRREALKNIGPA
jgi:3-methyladenine DNA glycosylase AlkD